MVSALLSPKSFAATSSSVHYLPNEDVFQSRGSQPIQPNFVFTCFPIRANKIEHMYVIISFSKLALLYQHTKKIREQK